MSNEYKRNHYVPEWYQRRFLLPGQKNAELYYLNFKPKQFIDSKGRVYTDKAVRRRGVSVCFAQDDLYTIAFRNIDPKIIEKQFFGEIDARGMGAVDYFENFTHPSVNNPAFEAMILFMSTQKLRTPKGLEWLAQKSKTVNKHTVLRKMWEFQKLYCAIWTECVWQIADASNSPVKFIVSDHPVTVYNRVCGPRSVRCRGPNDPEIWLNGTHTLYPLSANKILILTNLSWVRNPYQSELSFRPNPNPIRGAIFKYNDIQTLRQLTEQEVIDINYILKRRAYNFIAAAKEEWLFPEDRVSTPKWNEYGGGYLLMPDPRSIHLGGEVFIGHRDGGVSHFDAYGRRPWQSDYGKEGKGLGEAGTLNRFQGEFARMFGPSRRGRAFQFMSLDNERDSDEFHQYHLGLERRKPRGNSK
ncbi:DUF4238 domain-containing protein [Patescibacteria group bacterium]|jgi:hypothetical protein|nr:DUF4238 domain-containing protein [Patescibacteria group bacterium]